MPPRWTSGFTVYSVLFLQHYHGNTKNCVKEIHLWYVVITCGVPIVIKENGVVMKSRHVLTQEAESSLLWCGVRALATESVGYEHLQNWFDIFLLTLNICFTNLFITSPQSVCVICPWFRWWHSISVCPMCRFGFWLRLGRFLLQSSYVQPDPLPRN